MTADGATRFQHPSLGFALTLPASARVAAEVPPLILLGADRRWELPPSFMITVPSPGAAAGSLEEWVDRVLGEQATAPGVASTRLLDRGSSGPDGIRTLSSLFYRGRAITLEQWWRRRAEGRGWIISASCATLDYDELGDEIAALAASFEPPDGDRG